MTFKTHLYSTSTLIMRYLNLHSLFYWQNIKINFIRKTLPAQRLHFFGLYGCVLKSSPFVLQWASHHWTSSGVLGMQGPLVLGPSSQWTLWTEEASSARPHQRKALCHSSAHLVFSSASPPPSAQLWAGQATEIQHKYLILKSWENDLKPLAQTYNTKSSSTIA